MLSALLAGTALVAFATPAAAQFVPGPNPVTGTVGAQTLSSGAGTVDAGGKISVSGSGVALSLSGTSTLVNNGTIETLGSGRAIDSNSGASDLTVTNTGAIGSVSSDAFRVNTDSAVSLTNSGTIAVSAGGQAIDWAAIATKSNMLTNQATGVISAIGEDAVRPGTNGVVINAGTISATPTGGASPSGSDGIDLRTLTGIQVTNSGLITGRHGIATDGSNAGPSTITVTNNAGGTIAALNGSGLNIDGVSATVTATVTNQFGATFKGGVLAAATDGDGDGIDVDGVLTLNNYGDVLGLGAKGLNDGQPNGAQAISIGGGVINNYATGRIIGSTLTADAPNGDATRIGEGILADDSNGGNAVAVTTVTNDGLIWGKNGAGIRIISTFADSVTNNAGGTIQGAGTGAAIQMGNGNNIVTNGGSVIGGNGAAIDLQGGDDRLNLLTGSTVTGSIDGGAGTDAIHLMGAGTGALGNVTNVEALNVDSGSWTLNGTQAYSGGAAIANAATAIVNGTIDADVVNSGTVRVNGGSATFNGSFTNNGAYISDPSTQVFNGDLTTGTDGYIQAAHGDIYKVAGDFLNHSTQAALWNTTGAALEFTGVAGTDHELLLTSDDVGETGGFNGPFAWDSLTIDPGNTLTLGSGTGEDALAFYVREVIGAILSGDLVTNITGNGFNIYYDDRLAANDYLEGGFYDLLGGGQLKPGQVPEPASLALLLSGLGVLGAAARKRKKNRV